jgi:hypothetical protein
MSISLPSDCQRATVAGVDYPNFPLPRLACIFRLCRAAMGWDAHIHIGIGHLLIARGDINLIARKICGQSDAAMFTARRRECVAISLRLPMTVSFGRMNGAGSLRTMTGTHCFYVTNCGSAPVN